MRMSSAADYREKGKRISKRREPLPGTKLRALYDAMLAKPGIPVSVDHIYGTSHRRCVAFRQLRDFYGLDIRLWRRATCDQSSLYFLAGEWNGKTYTDHTERV